MLKVGLTGGIGSGKTYVSKIFEELGIPIYNADVRAKMLMIKPEIKRQIISLFGEKAYIDNQLNSKFIAEIVFNDKEKLEKLNNIVHPAVREDYAKWHMQQQAPYTIREAAILFESGSNSDCNKVITITAPERIRIDRVITRDGIMENEVVRRINNQWSEEEKIHRSDFTIVNDGISDVDSRVREIDGIIRRIKS